MIDETVEEIRDMQTHSSSAVAVKAARSLESLLEREFATVEEFIRALERNSDALQRASPSHASLVTTQWEIVGSVGASEFSSVGEAKEAVSSVIQRVVNRVEMAKYEAAENAVSILQHDECLLLHDYSTTVLSAIEKIPDDTERTVYVTEARPRYLGRKTARELADIPHVSPRLIVDSAAGFVMSKIDRVVVGMDCIVDSTLYNRVGTYPLAVVAKKEDVPMSVIGSSAKLVEGEFKFENDYRAVSEVIREPPVGFSVCNPAYDATPTDLLDSVITEQGIDYHQ